MGSTPPKSQVEAGGEASQIVSARLAQGYHALTLSSTTTSTPDPVTGPKLSHAIDASHHRLLDLLTRAGCNP